MSLLNVRPADPGEAREAACLNATAPSKLKQPVAMSTPGIFIGRHPTSLVKKGVTPNGFGRGFADRHALRIFGDV